MSTIHTAEEFRVSGGFRDYSDEYGMVLDPLFGPTGTRADGVRWSASLGINARQFGAKGDVRGFSDPAITGGQAVLTSAAQGLFTASDVGKIVQITGAGSVVTPTATTSTTTNPTFLTALSSIAGIRPGQSVSGAGIPVGATVIAIMSATVIKISTPVTATGAGVTITFANSFNSTILSYQSATQVTLAANATTTVLAAATQVCQIGTDDTNALSAWVNSLNSVNGATGIIPRGVYFTGPLPAFTAASRIMGVGRGPAPFGSTLLHKPGVSGDILTLSKLCAVEHLGIDGNFLNVTGTGRGIVVTDAYADISHVYVNGCIGNGVDFTTANSVGCFMSYCIVRYCQGRGIDVSNIAAFDNDFLSVNVGLCGLSGFRAAGSDCAATLLHSWGNGTLGTAGDGSGLLLPNGVAGCRWSNCYFENNGDRGVHAPNANVSGHSFTGCFIWRNWTQGINAFTAKNISISGCTVWENGQNKLVGGAGAAGIVNDTGSGWSLTGNTSYDSQAAKSQTQAYQELNTSNLNTAIANNWQAANHLTTNWTITGAGNIPSSANMATMNVG